MQIAIAGTKTVHLTIYTLTGIQNYLMILVILFNEKIIYKLYDLLNVYYRSLYEF